MEKVLFIRILQITYVNKKETDNDQIISWETQIFLRFFPNFPIVVAIAIFQLALSLAFP